ncbi:GAF domain-containing protein [Aquimarina brevivitae]|uniref:GAF domain-containing protein n=1 Tax=Aquimarina brevivitae TaxID=323412 RepID=A0A4Q7NTR6_9FLAO|nr:GAF domain-containing protein [Aquimarina brevivitae]RZS90517.1 hypothetical protein EV197_3311 [Aquimarina brevivitae]
MMINEQDFPLDIWISFSKFFEKYKKYSDSTNELLKERSRKIMAIAEQYPQLVQGIKTEEVAHLKPQIDLILEDSFAQILQENEIKIASIPFNNFVLKASDRYHKIIKAAGEDFEPNIKNLDEDNYYIMGCSIILSRYYGYDIDFRRPFFYDIPDTNGIIRHYRILYNGDFIDINKTDQAPDINDSDVAELLDNFDNIELWKEKFPPKSYTFKGIVIANLFDVTADFSISEFKTNLLKYEKGDSHFIEEFEKIFRAIFNLPQLKIGYASYIEEDKAFEVVPTEEFHSYILNEKDADSCKHALCKGTNHFLFEKGTYFAISDVEKFQKSTPDEAMYQNLLDQGINSAIIAPIIDNGQFLGIIELVSPNKYELNSINANKLQDLMPYLVDKVAQDKAKMDNQLDLIIQQECTSIHPSVYWKFKQEAKRFLKANHNGNSLAFREIVFEDVYPLYGQIDVKSSSQTRNEAVLKDLMVQLKAVDKVLAKILEIETLPIYDQIRFQVHEYIDTLINQGLQVNSESKILAYIKKEINPIFKHLAKKHKELKNYISAYNEMLDQDIKSVYKHRKAFDDSVTIINKHLAGILDKKQIEAQAMYPHYFERFKSDGVEHNLYIGESITKKKSFNKVYLQNLRLWQLQVMCEMENEYYQKKKELPVALDVASMILVFHSSLSVRFRMDEKRFDVDGTYNARYEVVKKRVDKAFIKGTQERVTEKGKMVIVYSQSSDEREYLKYIKFLQSKNYLEEEIEIVELEDLQGITGLKALRVNILYHKNEDDQTLYTYDDLMKELEQ